MSQNMLKNFVEGLLVGLLLKSTVIGRGIFELMMIGLIGVSLHRAIWD